ncbi:uncharacterized protein IL334_006327 [Kwoniella shivajii]|uniref:Flavin-containing monooxygenase n=1 Tax=Kwoniella shivajii TaxID=564305 RepID=A0ABZ1D6B1_9TREE|nr:hypothetical protein IL334_006327 [Kwoniella shivajii]
MAPTAVSETNNVAAADLKAKVVEGSIEIEKSPKLPLADNYMYDFKYNHALPTIQSLGADIAENADATEEAEAIIGRLSEVLANGDADGFADLFLEFGVWRDKLAFTWDYRTFNFKKAIRQAAGDLLPTTRAKNLRFLTPAPKIHRPYADLSYLQIVFALDTEIAGAHAVLNAVQTPEGWKVWTLHTVIESLHDFPELHVADGHMTGEVSWEKQRAIDDDKVQPEVVVVGGGQNGLALTARLKALGVTTLIVDHSAEIGEVWTKRYEYLSLHFPHWADHFPYFPYPERWPTYTPAQKQGLFMQWYASAMELHVWNSSKVVSAEQSESGDWTVKVNKGGKELRTLHPKHVVMATSLCGVPTLPVVPGIADWKAGIYRHSTAHDSSRDFVGKKVLVVGTSSSGFDTAYDCARRGIDVTLLQRSPTYIMSLTHSVPRAIAEELSRRNAETLENLDKELLDALHAKGLRTWRGQRGTGNATLGSTRNGGFYFDAGACEQIINDKIKVEPGFIEKFTEDKVILSGGRERHYDLIVFATGFSNTIDSVRNTLGDKIADQCGPIWGVDDEGEFKSAYKESGVPNLWIFVGYLPYTRFHSKRLALRLKALIAGVSPSPYKA